MQLKNSTKKFCIAIFCLIFASSFAYAKAQANAEKIPLEDLQLFTTVIDNIKNYYVSEVPDKELFEEAIRGMLAGLDPHSAYLDSEEFKDLQVSTSGKFGGLGIEVTMEDGFVKVITPIDDTPAKRAGISAGDLIIRLDETPVKGLSLRQAVEKMRGLKGEPITLTIIREGEDKPLIVTLKRDTISVNSIKSKLYDNKYAYVRISQFQVHTGDDLNRELRKLKSQSNNNLQGLVLDLRNNPGGVLDASVKVADTFLDKSKIGYDKMVVYTKGRLSGSEIKERAITGDFLKGAPIVILVNEGSASASEIVAGALQDHKRAIILGKQTFGKGSVQTILPLKDGRGLKLTTALYYTPSGRSIQAEGIVPDIIVDNLKVNKKADDNITSFSEADLTGHLANGNAKDKPADDKNLTLNTDIASEDYQLFEALNMLKGLTIYKN